MPQIDTKTIVFPLGGLDRRLSFQAQKPFTTPLCLNIWPIDPPGGRERGGVRPGCNSLGSIGGSAVYNWCRGDYYSSGIKEAIFVTTTGGTYESLNGSTWTQRISTAVAVSFPLTASCAVYRGVLYQAKSGAVCRQKVLPSGSEEDLSNAGGGTAPTNCGLVLHHADRLWLMSQSDAPHNIYCSAVGDATNWDTSDPTDGGAWENTGAEGGVLGHPVVAAISHNGILYFGGPTSVYVIRGNPKVGGTDQVGFHVGPVMNSAWCVAPDGYIYMITPDGLYRMPASGSEPQPVSRESIPNELVGINPFIGDRVCIGYDQRWRGLVISVDKFSGNDSNWFYKLPDEEFPGSWWPMTLPATMHLMATFIEIMTDDTSSVIPIASNATAYQFDRTSTEEFDSYVFLGPIYLGDPGSEGILLAVSAALAEGSEGVNWQVFTGDSAESAYQSADPPEDGDYVHSFPNASPHFTGAKWTRERFNFWQHPRCRGQVCFIKFFDSSNERWLLEDVVIRRKSLGLRRTAG